MITPPVECRAMAGPERFDALTLMRVFRADESRLSDALSLFVEREDYGFVWLAYREDGIVGCCSVAYAISTSAGGMCAQIRDLFVIPPARRSGVATAMLAGLRARLAALDIARIEIAVVTPDLNAFLTAQGFVANGARIFSRDR